MVKSIKYYSLNSERSLVFGKMGEGFMELIYFKLIFEQFFCLMIGIGFSVRRFHRNGKRSLSFLKLYKEWSLVLFISFRFLQDLVLQLPLFSLVLKCL